MSATASTPPELRCPKCDGVSPPGDASPICGRCGDTLYLDAAGLARAARDPYIGTLVAGRFGLESIVARGGMGVVYRATQYPIGRRVAVKVLRRELFGNASEAPLLLDRFRREAMIVSRLAHPNIVVLHDFGECGDGNLFMAFEYLEGPTLHEVLLDGALPTDRALRIAMQLASGLEAAHGHGIVHRDLKPGNVMLVTDAEGAEVVKLVDFGIARLDERDAVVDERLTLTGKMTGTPNYMSPEQIRGEAVDARSDVYALGLIVHEMLSGRPAFTGRSPITIVMAQLNDPPPRLRDVVAGRELPPGLEEVIEQAVRKDRGERFGRATDLRRALESVIRRGELSALWAGLGEEPAALFATLRRHAEAIIDLIVDDIRHTVEPYRTQLRADVRARVGFMFQWCTQVAPAESELSVFLDRVHRSGLVTEIRMADMISAFSLVFPALRSLVERFTDDERGVVQRHWPTLERHFWLLLRIVATRFEAVLSDPARDTWVDAKVPVATRVTAPHRALVPGAPPPGPPDTPEAGEFFENVLASMQSGVLVIDQGRLTIRAANPAFERILELPAREIIGRHVLDAFRALRGVDVAGLIAQVQERGSLPATKLRVRTPGGKDRWISVRGGLYRDSERRPRGVMILIEDVTEREFLVESFRRYVGPEVVEELLITRRGIELAGQRMEVTALFVGLMGPEGPGSVPDLALDTRPEETVRVLNRYFGIVVDAVTAERGLVDTLVKDTVMALFGAPFRHDDDPFAAVRAARRIRDQVALLNVELLGAGQAPLRLGMGLATGLAVVGNVGTPERVNYTGVGEVVYRADRLRLRAAADQILLDEPTHAALGGRVLTESVLTAEGRAFQVPVTAT
jgi:PAS domain S-box-containing protein